MCLCGEAAHVHGLLCVSLFCRGMQQSILGVEFPVRPKGFRTCRDGTHLFKRRSSTDQSSSQKEGRK